jgi:hypothetical protein
MNHALPNARSNASFVDSENADLSSIVKNAPMLVRCDEERQIVPGSSEDQNLRQWTGLISAAWANSIGDACAHFDSVRA